MNKLLFNFGLSDLSPIYFYVLIFIMFDFCTFYLTVSKVKYVFELGADPEGCQNFLGQKIKIFSKFL